MEKLQLLESVLGVGKHANRDYYQFICPFHVGRNGPKLGISLNNGNWKCWVCEAKGSTIGALFFKLRTDTTKIAKAKVLWKEKVKVEPVEPFIQISLPIGYKPLWERTNQDALNYALSRGLTIKDIIKHQVGYCDVGEWSGYLIFPVFNSENQLVYYSGRAFEPFKQPHKLPKIDKNVIGDEWLVNWNEDIVLVESKMNAITVRRNVITMYGKVMSKRLKKKIIRSPLETVYIGLDGDATKDINEIANYLLQNGKKVRQIILPPDKDINDIGHAKFWQLFEQSVEIKEQNTFELELKNKLNGIS